MSEKTVKLPKLQAQYLRDCGTERKRIERDIAIATACALAGQGIDVVEGMGYKLDGDSIVVTFPEE